VTVLKVRLDGYARVLAMPGAFISCAVGGIR
jgi:hypothetical protein